MTFSWAVKVFSHFHGFTNWKQTLKGKKFEQKKDPRKGQGERGRFCVIQMRFAIVGQARNEQQHISLLQGDQYGLALYFNMCSLQETPNFINGIFSDFFPNFDFGPKMHLFCFLFNEI